MMFTVMNFRNVLILFVCILLILFMSLTKKSFLYKCINEADKNGFRFVNFHVPDATEERAREKL